MAGGAVKDQGQCVGLYIHIPFCRRRCLYCDFTSFSGHRRWWQRYLQVLLQEIRELSPLRPCTLYVGGGTPTVWPAAYLEELIKAARAAGLGEGAEATVEANPGTVGPRKLALLRQSGYNRLSLGVQSTKDENLRLLGRLHTAQQAHRALAQARAAGFANINIDIIYGLPGQSLAAFREDLERALEWEPEHLSAYCLSLEPGTPLAEMVRKGLLPEPDPDLAADMYCLAEELLASTGYEHYELSNWARPGFACRHNLLYWRCEPYVGLGVSAYSFIDGKRFARTADLASYVRLPVAQRIAFSESIDGALAMFEAAMLGLRLVQGLSREAFAARFGVDPVALYAEAFSWAAGEGLLEVDESRVRFTQKGRLLSNEVFARMLPDRAG